MIINRRLFTKQLSDKSEELEILECSDFLNILKYEFLSLEIRYDKYLDVTRIYQSLEIHNDENLDITKIDLQWEISRSHTNISRSRMRSPSLAEPQEQSGSTCRG